MKITKLTKIAGGQDGALYGEELFRFDHSGNCAVYDFSELLQASDGECTPKTTFTLDRADVIAPHSNAVCFGCEFYAAEDEFPLLYTNVYNNYAQSDDPRIGVCCVYRLQRAGERFVTTLVQLIEIGFCEDASLWKVSEEAHGVRPYGNFLVDCDRGALYAYVMRNEALGTRYFRFDLPAARDGVWDEALGLRRAVLTSAQIQAQFDCVHHRFMQGGALHKGHIYSAEGFTHAVNRPAIRVVSLDSGEARYFDLTAYGVNEEPELIVFSGDDCYYSDDCGNFYRIDW